MKLYIVDAFTNKPYRGNPAAICLLDAEITDFRMQNIAAEMNLSETAFLYKQEEGYSLRWFTPESEVDLCGHATLASAHILWEEQISQDSVIRFATKSGTLLAAKRNNWIELDFPLEEEEPSMNTPQKLVDGLGADFLYIGKNRLDYIIELESEEKVHSLKPDFHLWKQVDARGVIVTSRSERNNVDFVSRCFYPRLGVNEDPVTGSAHCCLGPYWSKKLQKNALEALQLSKREGLLKLLIGEGRILISGQAVTVLKGELLNDG